MNFTPHFREEVIYGFYNQTSESSSGLTKLLHEKSLDFSIDLMAVTPDRYKVVDFIITGSKAGYRVTTPTYLFLNDKILSFSYCKIYSLSLILAGIPCTRPSTKMDRLH